MTDINLFTPGRIGELDIRNRMIMAPMTRNRATFEGIPYDFTTEYYRQRAGAGLILTEGLSPSASGVGYLRTPVLETPEQVAAWKTITDAVHAKGSRMYAQIMHVGRVGVLVNRPLQ